MKVWISIKINPWRKFMSLIKNNYPILERDTNPMAVIMPNRHGLYKLPKKCVFAFLGDTTDEYAKSHGCEEIAEFESITKKYPIYITNYKGEDICFCQAPCGASAATQILDFLISYGVQHIVSCGSCGVLTNIDENEILIPTEALRDEGTSYHYIEPSRSIRISPIAIEAIKKAAKTLNVKYEECKSWTTDGFFRETKEMVAYRVEEGCSVVEMECSALASCSEFRGVIFGQILFAADTLVNTDIYDERDWGKSAFQIAFVLSLEAVIQI
jgi:uridine phosphorylase